MYSTLPNNLFKVLQSSANDIHNTTKQIQPVIETQADVIRIQALKMSQCHKILYISHITFTWQFISVDKNVVSCVLF